MEKSLKHLAAAIVLGAVAAGSAGTASAQGTMGMMGDDDMDEMMMGHGMGMGPRMGYGMGMSPMMGHQSMGSMSMMGMNAYMHLDLTPEQQQKVREIMKESRQVQRKARDDIEDYAEELSELYSAESPDAKAIGAVYDKIFAAKRSVIDQSLTARAKINALLTDEQKKQMKDLRSHRGYGHPMMMR